MDDRTFVLASGNRGKLREITHLLEPLGFTVRPQSDWKVPEAAETASTFIENSLIKARQAASYTGLPCIADDSGLVVPALNGEPGIYSARYAGDDNNDEANFHKLLEKLSAMRGVDRNAHFLCAMVMVQSADDPAPLVAIGRWYGQILLKAQGSGGFGYDPVFGLLPLTSDGRNCSAAQLSPADKSRLSHRAQALMKLVRQMRERDDGIIA